MEGIHFVRGRGSNCTCSDCTVLYGGTCYTTPINNFLDRIEKAVIKNLDHRYISQGRINSSIEVIRPLAKKFFKIDNAVFDKHFYGWLPLIFIFTSSLKTKEIHPNASAYDVRLRYMQARLMIFWKLEEDYKLEKK